MIRQASRIEGWGRCRCCDQMREELAHSLMEALYELDVLPREEDGALVGIYAVIDDVEAALRRTEAMDLVRSRQN